MENRNGTELRIFTQRFEPYTGSGHDHRRFKNRSQPQPRPRYTGEDQRKSRARTRRRQNTREGVAQIDRRWHGLYRLISKFRIREASRKRPRIPAEESSSLRKA